MNNLENAQLPHIEINKFSLFTSMEVKTQDWMLYLDKVLTRMPKKKDALAYSMSNNTACTIADMSVSRPHSAYYSLNPLAVEPELLIELGLIDTEGTAKLHDYLNSHINFAERLQLGYHLVSGHYAKTDLGSIALLDQLNNGVFFTETQHILIATLIGHNILPIGGDGQPILLQ